MNLKIQPFGGILLYTSQGRFAVNGGGSIEAMERGYQIDEQPLRGMILTSEHIPMSRNVAAFANKHKIPLLVPLVTWAALGEHVDRPVPVFPSNTIAFEGLEVEFHFLRGDALEPVYLIVRDGARSLGIVPDGKLSEHTVAPLRQCDTLCLAVRPARLPGFPAVLRREIESVTNTQEEIAALFPDRVPILL